MSKIVIYYLGHSIMNGLKTFGDFFDAESIEGTQWDRTYVDIGATYIAPIIAEMLQDFMPDASEGSSIIREVVMAHNGMRAQGFSSHETNVNGALLFPVLLNNQIAQADIVVTHMGINDLRKDHRQSKAIWSGMKYLENIGEDIHACSDAAIVQTCEYLKSGEFNFTDADVQLFEYRARNGIDIALLKMGLQIFNINIRLAHGKSYAEIGLKLKNLILENLKELIARQDNSEALNIELNQILTKREVCCSLKAFVQAMNGFYSEKITPVNASKKIINLIENFILIQAYNYKLPLQKSAAEYFSEGEIELGLKVMEENGWTGAKDLLDRIASKELTLITAIEEFTVLVAPICAYSETRYCHLIDGAFHNAFNLFKDDIYETGAQFLKAAWLDISLQFPVSYTIDCGKLTEVLPMNETLYQDGLHWTKQNYDQLRVPLAKAITGILHGLTQQQLDIIIYSVPEAIALTTLDVVRQLVVFFACKKFLLEPTKDSILKLKIAMLVAVPHDVMHVDPTAVISRVEETYAAKYPGFATSLGFFGDTAFESFLEIEEKNSSRQYLSAGKS